jgi:hypothetical protein
MRRSNAVGIAVTVTLVAWGADALAQMNGPPTHRFQGPMWWT